MEYIENFTFDEITIGQSATISRTLTREDIELFAVMSGDVNPAHLDEDYAKSEMFQKIIAHGMWGGALISAVLGTVLPGPGTIYLGQTLKFRRPVGIGDTVSVTVTAAEKNEEKKSVVFDCLCANQEGKPVIEGSATVLAPSEKVRVPRPVLPEVLLHDRGSKMRQVVEHAGGLPAVRMAMVQPVEDYAVATAVEAAEAGLVEPVLIGPEDRIRAAAEAAGVDIKGFALVTTAHSHDSTTAAVAMARDGEVGAIFMSPRYAIELMGAAVARGTGIRTGRRMSAASVADMPYYERLLIVTDAYVNTDPNIEQKKDIVLNAVDLAHALGVETPKVALVAASHLVEEKRRSTIEAAALCKMADRGQITGALVEGPLTYDMAISEPTAGRKGVSSPVAGAADIIVCPHLEPAHLLVTQLASMSRAQVANVVLGARVPIIFPGPDDDPATRLAAAALATLVAAAAVES